MKSKHKGEFFWDEDFKFKVIERLLDHLSACKHDYVKLTGYEYPEIPYGTLKEWARNAMIIYGELMAVDRPSLKLMIYSKYFDYQQKLERQGEYEAAAKMLDRVAKFYGLADIEKIHHINEEWSPEYNIEIDENIEDEDKSI